MLVLSRNDNVHGFYQSKSIAGIPEQELHALNSRVDTFKLFVNPFRPLRPDRLHSIADHIRNFYSLPVSASNCIACINAMDNIGIDISVIKATVFDEFAKRGVTLFKASELTKKVVADRFVSDGHPFIMESIEKLRLVVETLFEGLDLDKVATFLNELTSKHISELDKESASVMGDIMFIGMYLNSIVDGDITYRILDALTDRDAVVFRYQDMALIYRDGKFKEYRFAFRTGRAFDLRKNVKSYIMMDEFTFFSIGSVDDGFLIMHDDVLPVIRFYDVHEAELDINTLEAGVVYLVDLNWRYMCDGKFSCKDDVTIQFKPVSGCVFKENEVMVGAGSKVVARNQIIINSNMFRFKISTKEKVLPFQFYAPETQIKTGGLPWM